ncbi:MAG TPA: class I SAM-dependent methyltransferase [Candidatus Polarisedimenticolaceae bacterium]|nr:class I SAM-dependent methyltransferase [Candidatus Polarisedimenticolaceae bacterium]
MATLKVDPRGNELRALARAGSWRGRRVLEIGCGDGRLTLRLAGLGAKVEAIDPDVQLVRAARQALPARFSTRVRYRVGSVNPLPFRDRTFERVVFAWSL